jgi:hypothetical protein
MVPTINHPLFDGTQTKLGPLKLGATYLGNALVWTAGYFVIATNEVPLPSFLSTILSSIEMGLELLPRGHELSMSYTFSLIEPFLPCSCCASHCLDSQELLEPFSQAL